MQAHTVQPSGQNGFVLLPVVLAITLIALIAFLLNDQRVTDRDATAGVTEAREAVEVARAGLAHAQWRLDTNGCMGNLVMGPVPFGPGGLQSYTATVNAGGVSTSHYTVSPDGDTWINELYPDSNYGSDNPLRISNVAGNRNYTLYHFDLSSISAGSAVVTATLRLYMTQSDPHGDLLIHRITRDWGEFGATWNSIGNGYETAPYGRIARQSAAGWVSDNLTAITQAWINNPGANHGILISTTSSDQQSRYSSREATADVRPYLDVTTADNAVSPVQISATGSLAPDALGNSLSRTVIQSNVPAYQPLNIYVVQGPDQVKDAWLNSSKSSLNYGSDPALHVAESGINRALLAFSLDRLVPGSHIVSASLELYATGVNSAGNIQVHAMNTAWKEGSCAGTGCSADGATWATKDGVAAWATPGGDYDPGSAASRQVATVNDWHRWDITGLVREWLAGVRPNDGLLLKSDPGVDITYISSQSTDVIHQPRLVIEYACECGSPCLAPEGSGKVLMVVDNAASPQPEDQAKQALLETWGYTVKLIGDESDQTTFNTEFSQQDVVYVSATADPAVLASKLDNAPIAVLSETGGLNANLGLAQGYSWPVGQHIQVTDNSHPITELFPIGQMPIYKAGMEGLAVSGTVSPDLQLLARWGSSGTVAVLDKGKALAGGGSAVGPRVMLPFGRDLDWRLVSNSGLLVLQRALNWGINASTEAPSCNGTYRDEFNAVSYSGNDGTLAWATDWMETGDSGGAASGDVMVTSDQSNNRLLVKNKDKYIVREANLSGAASATLTLNYRRNGLDDPADYVSIEVSGDGGNSWNSLGSLQGPNNDPSYMTTSYNISSFISKNTRIRFISSSYLGKQDQVFFDNVQITCTP
jgi:hypothetical protein